MYTVYKQYKNGFVYLKIVKDIFVMRFRIIVLQLLYEYQCYTVCDITNLMKETYLTDISKFTRSRILTGMGSERYSPRKFTDEHRKNRCSVILAFLTEYNENPTDFESNCHRR